MLKNLLILLVLFTSTKISFANENPFFGKYENQITVNLGQGFDNGFVIALPVDPVPYYMLGFQYSQPTTFFRLPARFSININFNIGFGETNGVTNGKIYDDATGNIIDNPGGDKITWKWDEYTVPYIVLSEDFIFYHTKKWYYGAGLGIGFQLDENDRFGSKLMFGLKFLIGYKLSEEYNVEFFSQHFSNGNTGYSNESYAFWGLGISHNF